MGLKPLLKTKWALGTLFSTFYHILPVFRYRSVKCKGGVHVSLSGATFTNKQKTVQIKCKYYCGLLRILCIFDKNIVNIEGFLLFFSPLKKVPHFSQHSLSKLLMFDKLPLVYYTPIWNTSIIHNSLFHKHVRLFVDPNTLDFCCAII